METLVINIENKDNVESILKLVKQLGEEGKILSKSDQEDYLLGEIIKSEKTGEEVSRATIFEKLDS